VTSTWSLGDEKGSWRIIALALMLASSHTRQRSSKPAPSQRSYLISLALGSDDLLGYHRHIQSLRHIGGADIRVESVLQDELDSSYMRRVMEDANYRHDAATLDHR
jgi:hypothetical protein